MRTLSIWILENSTRRLKMSRTLDLSINEDLKVVVSKHDGSIEDAQCWTPGLSDWVDCTERVKKSSYWKEKIQQEYEFRLSEEPCGLSLWKLAADR
jgi:hypothetical protein